MSVLKRQPETEAEYFEAIEALGGCAWQLSHDIGDGRVQDSSGETSRFIREAQQDSGRLVNELEKFGVIHPKDCPKVEQGQPIPPPPPGKKYYWDWYREMKESRAREKYEGQESMQSLGRVPCSASGRLLNFLERGTKKGSINK